MDAKTIYEQAGQVNRYFLNWRQGLLAGYFAILYGTVSLLISACEKEHYALVPAILAASGFIGIAFALAEWRNRECYHRASKVAKAIEAGVPGPVVTFGIYLGFGAALLLAAFVGHPVANCR